MLMRIWDKALPVRQRVAELAESALGGRLYRLILVGEEAGKRPFFGCQMCGQCILRSTGFQCPMQCPKQMRNGPCGGAADGHCEVYEDRQCIWNRAYERSTALGRIDHMEKIQPPVDWRMYGTSALLNHLAGRDDHIFPIRPEHQDLVADKRESPAPNPPK